MRYADWLLEELPPTGDLSDSDMADRYLPWSGALSDSLRIAPKRAGELRGTQGMPIADVDSGSLREDEWTRLHL